MATKTNAEVTRARREIVSLDVAGLGAAFADAFSRGGADTRHTIELLNDTIRQREETIKDLMGRLSALSGLVEDCAEKAVSVVFADAKVKAGEKKADLDHQLGQETLKAFERVANKVAGALPGLLPAQRDLEPVKRAFERVLGDADLCARIETCVGADDWNATTAWLMSLC